MDIKFKKEEVLFLIEKFARKTVKLHLNTIEISIVDDKYIKLAHQLNVIELNNLAYELAKDVAIQESKQSCTKVVIAYHNVNTWVSFGNIKIENNITIQSSNKSFNEVHYHENDLIIDTRVSEYEAQEEYECGCDTSVYGDDYDDYDYNYDEDDYDNMIEEQENRALEEQEEQERRELEDLEQYEEQVRESDEINHEIQAEMEQHMFENGEDYEDYQEPQSYDTEEDLVDKPAKHNEPVDIDELNNDLDEALKQ